MKTWEKPKLVILTRKSPQETVLSVCKGFLEGGIAVAANNTPVSGYESCMQIPGATSTGLCQNCYETSLS